MHKKILIVAKENTIPLAAASYDHIKSNNLQFKPIILLITPLEELIFKKTIRKHLYKRDYLPCLNSIRSLLEKENIDQMLKNKDEELYKKIQYEICSHPTQLYDLNYRLQFKNNNPDHLKTILYAQSIHLHNILSSCLDSKIIDFTIYDVSRTILLHVSNLYNIEYTSVIRSRFKNYVFKTTKLGKEVALYLNEVELKQQDIIKGEQAIKRFKGYKDITSPVEKNFIIPKYSKKETLRIIKLITRRILSFSKRFIHEIQYFLNNSNIRKYSTYITGNTLITGINGLIKDFRNLYRIWSNLDLSIKLPREFIYFPMPNTIENSETRFNNGILSEKILINFLRPYLGSISLVAKDHRSMLRDRTFKEIKEFSAINNVFYLSEWGHDWSITDPLNLINNSLLTISIAGTSGLEAAMLEKPVAILGTPIYGEYFNLRGYKNQEIIQVRKALKSGIIDRSQYVIPNNIVRDYVASTIKIGIEIDLYFLIENPFSDRLKHDLSKLLVFLLD